MNEYAILADGEMKLPSFDARVFNVPKDEVENVFIWRQMDAMKNSVQGLARSVYSHKELHGKSTLEMKNMCLIKAQNWDNLSTIQRIGFLVKKNEYILPNENGGNVIRTRWIIDNDIPFFVDESEYLTYIIEAE